MASVGSYLNTIESVVNKLRENFPRQEVDFGEFGGGVFCVQVMYVLKEAQNNWRIIIFKNLL